MPKPGGRASGSVIAEWQKQAALWRSELGISTTLNRWDLLNQTPIGLRLTPRTREILNLVVAEKTQHLKVKSRKNMQKVLKGVVVDLSQNPCRRNFTGSTGIAHTLCTSSDLYHLGRGAQILPAEMLWMQGHNPKVTVLPDEIAPTTFQKLAGEGMPLPCLGLCIWAIYLTKGFPDPNIL